MDGEMIDVKDQASTWFSFLKSGLFRIELARKLVQLFSFILFNAAILGLSSVPIVLPILISMGSPHKIVGEALGTIQWMLYTVIFPWIPIASIFLFAILIGRVPCGWVCPFGFIQDLLGYVRKKQRVVSPRTHGKMTFVKYFILLLVLFISGVLAVSVNTMAGQSYRSALGVFAEAPFNALSPSDTLFAVIPRIALVIRYEMSFFIYGYSGYGESLLGFLLSPLFLARILLMLVVLILVAYIPRSWCRYFCPQGAFSALFSRFSFLGLRRDPVKCTRVGCRVCVDVCPMQIRILDLPWEKFTDPECIYCLRCVGACQTKAIKPKFP